jgi:enoyl-CoA hydratase/carnithine racemase
MADQVSVEVSNRILSIRMDRPEKKNALTRAMYVAMTDAIRQAEASAPVRAILITGTADSFTAGNDLLDFASAAPGETSPAIAFLQTLAAAQKPVIAAVNGIAIGIGTTMLLHCDLVYAASSARFQLPFVNLGLCPEAASSFILPSLVGHHRAAELLFLGAPFGADSARDLGIVNEIYSEGELLAAVTAKVNQLAEQPPTALRVTKALLKHTVANATAEAMDRETKQFAMLLQGPEAREAMTAFMQRRKPDFSNF